MEVGRGDHRVWLGLGLKNSGLRTAAATTGPWVPWMHWLRGWGVEIFI